MKSGAGVPLTGSLRTFVCGTGRVYIPQYFFVASDRGFDSASEDYFLSASGSTNFVFCLFFVLLCIFFRRELQVACESCRQQYRGDNARVMRR